MKKKVSILEVFLTVCLLICLGIIGKLIINTRTLKENFISLVPGDTMADLELMSLDNKPIDKTVFNSPNPLMICIFEIPCMKCNFNLGPWKALTSYFGQRITVIGILVEGDPEAFNLLNDGRVNFKLFLPVDKEKFKRKMRLKTKLAQTMIVFNQEVITVTLGNLDTTGVQQLMATIYDLFKKMKEKR
jgi:hypothetical protein